MYNLGEQFKMDMSKTKANPESIIKGEKYRITILSDNLYRFEYSETGSFTDLPTELVINRSFDKVEYNKKEDNNYLEITTKYAKIMYTKNKNFDSGKVNPAKNFSVKILNTDRFWYYNHPEARNIGTMDLLDEKTLSKANKLSDLKLPKGLYSYDSFVSIDDSNSKLLNEDGIFIDKDYKSLDIYLFVYKDFKECLNNYYHLTGYPSLIPRYALGNWWYKNDDYNDEDLAILIDNFRNNKIPLSVLELNDSWHTKKDIKKKLTSGFTFDSNKFKNPNLLIDYLHKTGVYLGLPVNPFNGFYDNDTYYEKALSYLEEKDGHIPFNVLDPKVVDVYLKLFMHPLDSIGTDFYDIDYNSNKNELSYLKHYLYKDMGRNYKKRPLVISSNINEAHRYSIIKSDKSKVDWLALKKVALYNIMSSTKGITWWMHDALYKDGVEDNELYTRYIELLTFSPILRLSSDRGKYYKREPWRWSIKTNTIVNEFLTLRHKLIPYLYSEAYKYSKGDMFIKPLFFDMPNLYDDETYYNEYYFGSELLVSPIIKSKDIVMNRSVQKIYMPEGTWYDFFSGKKYPGGREYVSFYREQDYPVFAHAGSIIPMGLNDNINDTNPPKNMEIHIFPGKNNTYHMYEDDGISSMNEKGFYLLTDIDYNYMPNNYTVIIRAIDGKSGIIPDHRNYKIVFRNTKKADDVTVYSNDIKMEYTSYVNGPDFIVEVKNAKTIGQITINCKGKDIEIDALRIINSDIERILSDIEIPTEIKEKLDAILFDKTMDIPKKRIAIRKLKGVEGKFERLFLRLLEYVNQV